MKCNDAHGILLQFVYEIEHSLAGDVASSRRLLWWVNEQNNIYNYIMLTALWHVCRAATSYSRRAVHPPGRASALLPPLCSLSTTRLCRSVVPYRSVVPCRSVVSCRSVVLCILLACRQEVERIGRFLIFFFQCSSGTPLIRDLSFMNWEGIGLE